MAGWRVGGLTLAPAESRATLPTPVSTLARLFAAAPFSLFTGRYGRQVSFVLGAVFAAAEVVPDSWRSVAISLMLTSGLVAALVGLEFFARTQDVLVPISFAGSYRAIIGLAVIGVPPLLFLRRLRAALVRAAGGVLGQDQRCGPDREALSRRGQKAISPTP